MKNPDWNREELILAIDLYFKIDYGQMHGRNPKVIQLSQDLRTLNLHSDIPDKNKFRSPSSVALKLANIKKSDQNFKGKGMRDGGKLEKILWNEFYRHRGKLKKEAALIRQLYLKAGPEEKLKVLESRSTYKSDFLFCLHKNRENDPLMIQNVKQKVLTHSKSLKCEVCRFDSDAFYGELGSDLMEIHCHKELTNDVLPEISVPADFIIVCSNCHKVLDKNYDIIGQEDLRKIIRKKK